jgi:hypothetical protein
MIRALDITSGSVLAVGAATLALLFTPAAREPDRVDLVEFPSFAVGVSRKVQFSNLADVDLAGAYDNEADQRRRQLEQLRDWCLLAIISASDLPAKAVSEATYDLPMVRQEGLRRITTFEYGETRSRPLSESDIVALVPASSPEVRADQLGRIADEQRKNLGNIPRNVHVFEYALRPEEGYAQVTRLPVLRGADLFTVDYGYHERPIRSRADLETFLGEVDDLATASRQGDVVTVGGRRRLRTEHRKLGIEEVAAIWRGQQGLPEYQGVGFSLDPRLDVVKANQKFDAEFGVLLRGFLADPKLIADARGILTRPATSPQDKVALIYDFTNAVLLACAKSADAENCVKLVSNIFFGNSYQVARYDGNNLAGTQVGMVLFYTDLLMKLWSFDFDRSAPRSVPGFPIQPEMRLSPVYRGDVERAPESRLWLEPLDKGYQISDQRDTVYFAPTATRVSVRAHSSLTGDHDFEPNVFHRVFIDWWNDHYDEIARYEPQYQQLNEIVKWGVVVAWLDLRNGLNSLAFLSDSASDPVHVSRNHRFPVWKDQHAAELTFKSWDKINFDRPDQGRAEYESLELLTSREIPYFTGPIWFQGGVTLSTRAAVAGRAALSGRLSSLEATARRAGVDTRLTNLAAGRLRTLEATSYEFNNYSRQAVSMLARAKPSARLRDAFGEIQNIGFDRSVRRTTDGLLLRTRAEGGAARLASEVGELRIARMGADFRVAWQSRDLDLGYSLARRMSMSDDIANVASANPNVELTISLGEGKGVLVKARGSDSWIRFAPAGQESKTIAAGFHARVAGVGNHARTIDIAWVENSVVQSELQAGGYLTVVPDRAVAAGARLHCCVRGPPEGAARVTFRASSHDLNAFADRAGRHYVRAAELPEAVRSNLSTLSGRLPRLDPGDVQLAGNLKRGEFRNVADMLARNRLEYEARVQRILEEELQFQRALVEQRQFATALTHLDDSIRTYGSRAELSAQKAVVEIKSGNVEAASAALNNARFKSVTRPERFLDEMEHALARAQTDLERTNHVRVMEWMRWQKISNKSGEVVANARAGQLTLELKVGRLPAGRQLSGSELDGILVNRNATIYIQDRPGLHNIDLFNTPGRQSLHQLVKTRAATVYEVQLNDLAAFRPSVLHEAATQASYRLVPRAADAVREAGELAKPDESCGADDPRQHCGTRVYVVQAGR